jgi:alginate O-acetyltransferase complex protein AlgJ
MLKHYRRYWFVVVFALLLVPATATVVTNQSQAVVSDEFRAPALTPSWPQTSSEWTKLPEQIDKYLREHFGLRREMIRAHAVIDLLLRTGNADVFLGAGNSMFYRGDLMIQQSAGLILRSERVTDTANDLVKFKAALAKRGIKLVVAAPPNASTIYPDRLPEWARNSGRTTEYDLMFSELNRVGVGMLDLRPILSAQRAYAAAYYLHDSHWTPRGAVAAFNAVAAAAGHQAWTLDPKAVLGPEGILTGGELARMLGVSRDVTERVEPLVLAAGKRREISSRPLVYEVTPESANTTVMIIGDSFTQAYFPMLIASNGARGIWLHHLLCDFEWRWIDELNPSEVWFMPTERYILCSPAKRSFPG